MLVCRLHDARPMVKDRNLLEAFENPGSKAFESLEHVLLGSLLVPRLLRLLLHERCEEHESQTMVVNARSSWYPQVNQRQQRERHLLSGQIATLDDGRYAQLGTTRRSNMLAPVHFIYSHVEDRGISAPVQDLPIQDIRQYFISAAANPELPDR